MFFLFFRVNRIPKLRLPNLWNLTKLPMQKISKKKETALIPEKLKLLQSLKQIPRLRKNQILNLSNQFLIVPFAFKNTTVLFLSDNQIDDRDIKFLPLLTSLTSLDVSGDANSISDLGIQALALMKNLTYLDLSAAIITEDSIQYLFPLSNLLHLNLSLNDITDFSVQYLSSLTCLTSLNLNDNKITNVGLQYLFPLENLIKLYLDGNQATNTDDESDSSDSSDILYE